MRQTDTQAMETDQRKFVNTQEWPINEKRQFYFTGYEKVHKVGKTSGKPYTQYFIYLLPIDVAAGVQPEVTLGIFPKWAAMLKEGEIKNYQEVHITKIQDEQGEAWTIEGQKGMLEEKSRPKVAEYPEVPAPVLPADEPKSERRTNPIDPTQEEINIDDIPFR